MQIMYLLLGWQRIKQKNKKGCGVCWENLQMPQFFVHVIGKFSLFYIKIALHQ